MITERSSIGIGLLLIGTGLMWHTYQLGFADLGGAFSPVFFPRIVLAMWILLSLASLAADIMNRASTPSARWTVLLIIMAALLGYILMMPRMGFFASSVVFAAIMLVTAGQRRIIPVLTFSIALPGVLVILFNHVLTMPLPVSPYFWWI